ncbi:MAG: hypothetical protein ACTSU5_20480, partial [Promethearchaeota archaeon]
MDEDRERSGVPAGGPSESENLQGQLAGATSREVSNAPPTNDELTVLSAIGKRRLFLSRIAIIVNQTRAPLGLE